MPTDSATFTNVDTGSIEHHDGQYADETLTFDAADTFVAGTILARDSVSLKLVLYVIGGSANENGIPKAVLTYDVTRGSAGDEQVRVLVAGTVNQNRLVVDADGDDSNITAAIRDQLRTYGIVPTDVVQIGEYDYA